MASGRMAPSNAKSGRNVDPTLRPDSRLAFQRQVRQTHGTHGTQGIIFADVASTVVVRVMGEEVVCQLGRAGNWVGGYWCSVKRFVVV